MNLFLQVPVILSLSHAQAAEISCNWVTQIGIKEYCPKQNSSFFFDTTEINGTTYILYSTSKKIAIAYNTKTHEEFELPASYDVVAIGDLATTPERYTNQTTFFSFSEMLAGEIGKITPKFIDPSLKGAYQSMGSLSPDNSNVRVAVETQEGGVEMRDYTYDKNKGTVKPKGKLIEVCRGMDLKTPKLSHKGKYLTAYDTKSLSSKIFEIGKNGKTCIERHDFKELVGKIDFDDDSQTGVFHLSSVNLKNGPLNYRTPGALQTFNSFLFDMKTGTISSISQDIFAASYYPTFSDDKKSIFFSRLDSNKNFCFYSLPIKNLQKVTPEYSCPDSTKKISDLVSSFLDDIDKKCREEREKEVSGELLKTLDCQSENKIEKWQLLACGRGPEDDFPNFKEPSSLYDKALAANTVFKEKCLHCHSEGLINPFKLSPAERKKFTDKFHDRMQVGEFKTSETRMPPPPAKPLTLYERNFMLKYLLEFR